MNRYGVHSVTGYGEAPGSGRPPVTIWYVHDRYDCFRVVARTGAHTGAERLARRIARRRNDEERRWEREHDA